jgi:hypothetical protein
LCSAEALRANNKGSTALLSSGGDEWRNLPWRGYIHTKVQEKIVESDRSIRKEYTLADRCRADLYREISNEVWEVKPISHKNDERKRQKARDQLDHYINQIKGGKLGGFIPGMTFVTEDGKYTVQYWWEWDSLIFYTFKENKEEEREANDIPVVLDKANDQDNSSENENKGDNSIHFPQLTAGQIVAIVAGVIVGAALIAAVIWALLSPDPVGELVALGLYQLLETIITAYEQAGYAVQFA